MRGRTVSYNSLKCNQQDATLYNILYCCQCCTWFRRFFRPSSGAQTLHKAYGICQACVLLSLAWVSWQCCGRNLYYWSYNFIHTWSVGVVILFLTIGYVLPWGQISIWGATVITDLLSAIPYEWKENCQSVWGGFAVDSATLNTWHCQLTHASRSSKQAWHIPDAVCTVWAPDDGRKNRLKHVEHWRQ